MSENKDRGYKVSTKVWQDSAKDKTLATIIERAVTLTGEAVPLIVVGEPDALNNMPAYRILSKHVKSGAIGGNLSHYSTERIARSRMIKRYTDDPTFQPIAIVLEYRALI